MTERASLSDYFATAMRSVDDWSKSSDPFTVAAVLVAIAVVIVFRRKLGRWAVDAGLWVMRRLSAELGEDVRQKLTEGSEVLIVTLACYIGLQVIDPPAIYGGVLQRLIVSVAVLAVFAAWYRLAGPFISLMRNERFGDVRVEEDWIVRVTEFAIVLFGVTSLLNVWDIDISGALTGVGVLGAGLAIAAQDLIRNLIAGMTNLSEERFETGDAIEVPGMLMGTVEKIDLRSTLIVGFDQIPRHVPNADLANSVVLNFSRMQHRRLWIEIPLVLSTTAAQIEEIKTGLRAFAKDCGLFDLGPGAPFYVYASNISDHAIELLFVARTTASGYEDMLKASEAVNLEILSLVAAAGTELAYPTQTIDTVIDTAASQS